jgi:DNA polymerase-1
MATRKKKDVDLSVITAWEDVPNATNGKPSTAVFNCRIPDCVLTDYDELCLQLDLAVRAGVIFFDTETTGLGRNREIVGFSFAYFDENDQPIGWYVPVSHVDRRSFLLDDVEVRMCGNIANPSRAVDAMYRALCRCNYIVMHNAKFDVATLRICGYDVDALPTIYDTLLLAFLLGEDELGLKALVKRLLRYTMTEFSSFDKRYKKQARLVPVELMAPYATDDVVQLARLWRKLNRVVEKQGMGPKEDGARLWKIFTELECPVMREIEYMEHCGFEVDVEELRRLSTTLFEHQQTAQDNIARLLDLPPEHMKLGSTQWLSLMMIDKLKAWGRPPEGRGKTGSYSTAKGNLEKWAEGSLKGTSELGKQVATELLFLRKVDKLRSTYTEALVDKSELVEAGPTDLINIFDGPRTATIAKRARIHSSFNQTGARTGRWSSSNPNLQNIPTVKDDRLPDIRKAFVCQDGYQLVVADYSQIELRLMAHFSQDPNMMEVYRVNGDIHQRTADGVGCSRKFAKGLNFGLLYGMGHKKLAIMLKISEEEAKVLRDGFFALYKRIQPYSEACVEYARRKGFVETIIGRRRYLDDIHSDDDVIAGMAGRQATNTTIQGSASDLIKIAYRNIGRDVRERGWVRTNEFRFTSQVHDELIFEVKDERVEEAKEIIKHRMETALPLRVPLVAEPQSALSWSDAK